MSPTNNDPIVPENETLAAQWQAANRAAPTPSDTPEPTREILPLEIRIPKSAVVEISAEKKCRVYVEDGQHWMDDGEGGAVPLIVLRAERVRIVDDSATDLTASPPSIPAASPDRAEPPHVLDVGHGATCVCTDCITKRHLHAEPELEKLLTELANGKVGYDGLQVKKEAADSIRHLFAQRGAPRPYTSEDVEMLRYIAKWRATGDDELIQKLRDLANRLSESLPESSASSQSGETSK